MLLAIAITAFAITTFLILRISSQAGRDRRRLERFTGSPSSKSGISAQMPFRYRLSSMIYSKRYIKLLPIPVAFLAAVASMTMARNFLMGTLWGASTYMVAYLILSALRARQMDKINSQLIDVVNSLVGSIKAGLSLPQAFQILAEEPSLSISREFMGVVNRIQLGATVQQALEWLNSRIPIPELRLVISVLLIYQDVGGDLSYMLEKTADALRYRIRLKGEIRRSTAQTRLSAVIGVAIPFGLAFFIYNLNPGFLTPLYTTRPGLILLSLGLAMSVTGVMIIYRIVRGIEF
ncbi:type II secretion system F family protein [Candidatus Poribacteria bacterium]|nr:type II secretion system F family protein [Candidatus Poribacteria bacterium]